MTIMSVNKKLIHRYLVMELDQKGRASLLLQMLPALRTIRFCLLYSVELQPVEICINDGINSQRLLPLQCCANFVQRRRPLRFLIYADSMSRPGVGVGVGVATHVSICTYSSLNIKQIDFTIFSSPLF